MPITSTTHSAQALEAYSRIADERADRLRAEQTTRAVRSATEAGRVRKRSFGFSLGKFAVDFTAHDVELPPEHVARQTAPPQRESFDADLEAAALLNLATAPRPGASASPAPKPDTSTLTRHKALQAYAEASLTPDAPAAVPGRTIGNV